MNEAGLGLQKVYEKTRLQFSKIVLFLSKLRIVQIRPKAILVQIGLVISNLEKFVRNNYILFQKYFLRSLSINISLIYAM